MIESLHNVIKDAVGGNFANFLGYWLLISLFLIGTISIFRIALNFIYRVIALAFNEKPIKDETDEFD